MNEDALRMAASIERCRRNIPYIASIFAALIAAIGIWVCAMATAHYIPASVQNLTRHPLDPYLHDIKFHLLAVSAIVIAIVILSQCSKRCGWDATIVFIFYLVFFFSLPLILRFFL